MTMPVFYRPEMSTATESFSPSADKPRQFVEFIKDYDIDVLSFEPVTVEDLYLAHDKDFVDGVMAGEIANGFGNRDLAVAQALLYTTGSMLAAAEHVLLRRQRVACSPTSGFHHAGYDFAGGYCTFNGLMVTALKLKKAGLINTIGILDCDAHYGNGTADIIDRLGLDWATHHTAGKYFQELEDVGTQACLFFDWLGQAIDDVNRCDLVLYQAGADPHIADPLGGLLNGKQLFKRDLDVFSLVRKPLVWNLAGGYRRDSNGKPTPVLMTHRATLEAAGVGRKTIHETTCAAHLR